LRQQTGGQSKRAQRVGDKVRALVVNANLTPHEVALVLSETMWSVLATPPAPPFDG
jgi:hypothetical protein